MALFYFLSLILFLLSSSCKSSPNCLSTSSCGKVSIYYPFSLYNPYDVAYQNSSLYCGYPGLRIYCKNNVTPFIYLNSDNYTVTKIDCVNQIISLTDTDVFISPFSCPKVRHNVTLNTRSVWLSYTSSDVDLTFFFNCTPFPVSYIAITCLESTVHGDSYVFPSEMISSQDYTDWVDKCSQVVATPVIGDILGTNSLNLSYNYGTVLNSGFELEWYTNSQSCSDCESKGGMCLYNMTSESTFVQTCFCATGNCAEKAGVILGLTIGSTFGFCALLVLCIRSFLFVQGKYNKVSRIDGRNKTLNIEATLENCATFAPKRYNFHEIIKITRSFSEKLGQGGYGTVFKGKLTDGTLVAVKVFKDHKSNGEDFINEVASIARTSHVNIVRLLGFSITGSKRVLIYEFMPNGSLDKYLHENQSSIMSHVECERLFEITIGIARGLEYLHRGCITRIIHFDIKPHNILLDQDFCPKISDFGLAKFCRPKESVISMSCMRGTIGYIAPEVFSRNFGTISSKSDVYSYGMMVLDMLGGKQNKTTEILENSSETYFPDNIYKHLEENTISSIFELSKVNEELVRKMAIVGLWCIQVLPEARPTMSRVLDMLEGRFEELIIPQKLRLALPPELVVGSCTTEELS